MRSRIVFFVLTICLSTLSGTAQVVPATLSEADAVQMALRQHPLLRAAQAEGGQARARVSQAQAEARLQVSGNVLAMSSNMTNVLTGPSLPQALLQSQDRASLDLNAMLMLPLYTGGRIASNIRSEEWHAQAAQHNIALIRTQIAYAARVRFDEWQAALAAATVADDTLTAQTRNTQVAQQLYEEGKVPRFDLLRSQAEQAAARQQQATTQAEVTVARAQLAQALGVADTTIPAVPTAEVLPPTPIKTLDTALKTRPDLHAAQQSISAAEATLNARKATYHPQVYAFGMLDTVAPSVNGKAGGYSLGLLAGIPILDGGRRKAEVEEAEQAVEQARANLDAIFLQIRADVAGAEARVTAARRNIDTASAQVTAAVEAATVAQARYAGEKGTMAELLDAQRTLTEAQQNQVTAQARYRSALATLYLAMGLEFAPTVPS